MPEASPENTGYVRTDSMLAVIRVMLRRLLLVSAVITVLAVGIGYLVAGLPGVWAALIGAAISVLFNGATVLSMYLVAGRSPELLQIVLLGGWLVKMVLLVIALVWLREQDFYHRGVLVVTLVVVVVAALLVEVTTVVKARLPYVEPSSAGTALQDTNQTPQTSKQASNQAQDQDQDQAQNQASSRGDTGGVDGDSDVDHRSSQERHDRPDDQVG